MKLQRTLIIACLAGSLATAGSLFATEPNTEAPVTPPPAAETKGAVLTMDEARVIALDKVPGDVHWEGLARYRGQLIYSFEIQAPEKKGFEVVTVGAADRQVLEVKHKTAWAQRRDAAKRRQQDRG